MKSYLYYEVGEEKDKFEVRGNSIDMLNACVNMSIEIIKESGVEFGEFVTHLMQAWEEGVDSE